MSRDEEETFKKVTTLHNLIATHISGPCYPQSLTLSTTSENSDPSQTCKPLSQFVIPALVLSSTSIILSLNRGWLASIDAARNLLRCSDPVSNERCFKPSPSVSIHNFCANQLHDFIPHPHSQSFVSRSLAPRWLWIPRATPAQI